MNFHGAALAISAVVVAHAGAQLPPPNPAAIDVLAVRVAAEGTAAERTGRLVAWINREFAWTATDYQRRTPEEIIERRGGNCADLARVLARLLDAAGIRYRFVREINVQPASDSRQANAERRIAASGARYSVFGRRHNDHTWLEVLEPGSGEWIPADPAIGIVGAGQWIRARLAFSERLRPAVPATVPIVETMLVPFAVAAGNEDRSAHYLIDAFDNAYGGRLHALPAWTRWTAVVRALAALAAGAFSGELNLHEHAEVIARVADAYDALKQEAARARLTLDSRRD